MPRVVTFSIENYQSFNRFSVHVYNVRRWVSSTSFRPLLDGHEQQITKQHGNNNEPERGFNIV